MSAQAQRIIASHKEAAKRASDFLQSARNLKLKHGEALELVARVLGAANWQTLNELALQGRAPRSEGDSSTAVLHALPVVAAAPTNSPTVLARLADWYSDRKGWGDQHPSHTRADWAVARLGKDMPADYWSWVHSCMSNDGAMLPWTHATHPDVLIARAGGADVDFDGEFWDATMSPNDQFAELPPCRTEAEGWKQAAEAVATVALKAIGGSRGIWLSCDLGVRLDIVRRGIPKTWASGLLSPEKEGLLFGELPAEERLLNDDVALCRALGVPISYEAAPPAEARGSWTDNEGAYYRTEAEGWATRALLAQQAASRQGLVRYEDWENLPRETKIELAMKALKPAAFAKKYGALLAEQRRESPDVAIAQAAGLDVFRQEGAWRMAGGPFGDVFSAVAFDTELAAWQKGAEKAWARVVELKKLPSNHVHVMPPVARILVVKDAMKTLELWKAQP